MTCEDFQNKKSSGKKKEGGEKKFNVERTLCHKKGHKETDCWMKESNAHKILAG